MSTFGLFGRGRLGSAIRALAPELSWCVGRAGAEELGRLSDVQVVIDASDESALAEHLDWATTRGAAVVAACTGANVERMAREASVRLPVVLVPNGSVVVGAVERLVGALGELAAREGGQALLVDEHHQRKRDAPSGTARRWRSSFERAWKEAAGAASRPELAVCSQRLGEEIGRHTLRIDFGGEVLEVTHRARSREIFARGVLRCAHWLAESEPESGLYTLDDVAELDRSVRANDDRNATRAEPVSMGETEK